MTDKVTEASYELDKRNGQRPRYEDVLLDILLTPAPQVPGNINPSRDIGMVAKHPAKLRLLMESPA